MDSAGILRAVRIYTRTGDSGQTALFGGERLDKDAPRIEAVGTIDEACAALGIAAAQRQDAELSMLLTRLQSDLFVLGADLATPLSRGADLVPRLAADAIDRLEALIDSHEAELEPLRNFILPGGAPAAAALHLARTIVRRAERRVTTLLRLEPDDVNPETLRYLNRLSDLLFVLARVANRRAGIDDIPWRNHQP